MLRKSEDQIDFFLTQIADLCSILVTVTSANKVMSNKRYTNPTLCKVENILSRFSVFCLFDCFAVKEFKLFGLT